MKITGDETINPIQSSISYVFKNGLTIRQYFAAMAMQGFSVNRLSPEMTAELSVKFSDALINELNKETK